ncbi:class II fructose-bisphosphate aldolase [Patescibacteria group bacterium]|nr:MAG: class II fructose-bisphosphate aldolase [Patescibacteria group bacterium]
MKSLKSYIKDAEKRKVAIGHFNISDLAGLKAIFEAAKELSEQAGRQIPVIIGLSDGERGFVGIKQAAAMVKNYQKEYAYPIFLNSDHTHDPEDIKKCVEAGFDAVLFDAGKLSLEENIQKTKDVVAWVRQAKPKVLVEGELGFIGASSVLLDKLPEGAAIREEDLTTPEQAERFVRETGVDLIAPAVGNIHGMFKNAPNPNLSINRIKDLRKAGKRPIVLHGGSGTSDADFVAAIEAGVSIIHINTEIRRAWRQGIENVLKNNPDQIVPYKLLQGAIDEMKKVITQRLKLFNRV